MPSDNGRSRRLPADQPGRLLSRFRFPSDGEVFGQLTLPPARSSHSLSVISEFCLPAFVHGSEGVDMNVLFHRAYSGRFDPGPARLGNLLRCDFVRIAPR